MRKRMKWYMHVRVGKRHTVCTGGTYGSRSRLRFIFSHSANRYEQHHILSSKNMSTVNPYYTGSGRSRIYHRVEVMNGGV